MNHKSAAYVKAALLFYEGEKSIKRRIKELSFVGIYGKLINNWNIGRGGIYAGTTSGV